MSGLVYSNYKPEYTFSAKLLLRLVIRAFPRPFIHWGGGGGGKVLSAGGQSVNGGRGTHEGT